MGKQQGKARSGFTVLDNCALRDRQLSLKARGLLATMVSLPPGWRFSVRGLAEICKEGKAAVGSAVEELERLGYLRRTTRRAADGTVQKVEYIIYEKPVGGPVAAEATVKRGMEEGKAKECGAHGNRNGGGVTVLADSKPECGKPVEKLKTEKRSGAAKKEFSTSFPQKQLVEAERKGDAGPPAEKQVAAEKRPQLNKQQASKEKTNKQSSSGAKELRPVEQTRRLVYENIEYEWLCKRYGQPRVWEVAELMVEVLCSQRPQMRIAGSIMPMEMVQQRFLQLDSTHIGELLERMDEVGAEVKNIKSYLLAGLFNATVTQHNYWQAMVSNHKHLGRI